MANRVFLLLACFLTLATTSFADGVTQLTVVGEITKSNRGALVPFRDAFLKFNDRAFKRAYTFDRARLLELPQKTIRANVKGWPHSVAATGPLLREVLEEVGASEAKSVTFVALDGYAASLNLDDIVANDWILSLEMNGTPLGIGGRGPLWLMHDTGDTPLPTEDEAKWVWSIYLIVVGDDK